MTVGCEPATDDTPAMFCPTDEVSRAQVSAFLYRCYMDASAEPADTFGDVDTAAYYAAAVAWMSAYDITTGCRTDMFCPARSATRAHVAAFLYRIATNPRSWGPDPHLQSQLVP